MQQVKIFKSVESDISTLETDINDWLKRTKAQVLSLTGNIAPQSNRSEGLGTGYTPSDVLVVLLYETT